MPTFEETLGTAEAQRIAHDSFQKVTQSEESLPLFNWQGTLKDCGITTPSLRDRLLHEVGIQVRLRGFKIHPRFLRSLNIDSDVGSLVQTILWSLPGDEDFEDPPPEDEADFRNTFKRTR